MLVTLLTIRGFRAAFIVRVRLNVELKGGGT